MAKIFAKKNAEVRKNVSVFCPGLFIARTIHRMKRIHPVKAKLRRRIYVIRFEAQWYSDPPVDKQEDGPRDCKNNGVRNHHGDQRSDTGFLHVSLAEYHDKRKVRQ